MNSIAYPLQDNAVDTDVIVLLVGIYFQLHSAFLIVIYTMPLVC